MTSKRRRMPWYRKSLKGKTFDCATFCVIGAALGHRLIQRRPLINKLLADGTIIKLGHNCYALNITGI